ncbi:anterior gradient 1 [Sebastes umbrosus]|uniref:anterior gradient 1 n=1 Tax=Sebastes umbrosus TaxID=72105 RepID=UPI0018A0685D|nr:anterior gradient 1 [Sebastes umbrosus]
MLRWVLFALCLGICASASARKEAIKVAEPSPLSRGWGDSLDWVESYEKGLEMLENSKKPLMVIIHKENCTDCEALKKAFVASHPIQKMAKEDFIMVNLLTIETTDKNLAPDGDYVPRILFFGPSKTLLKIGGKYSTREYTYDPSDMVHLSVNMQLAKTPKHSEL